MLVALTRSFNLVLFDVYVLINALHVDADQVFVCVRVCVCV